MRVDLCRRKMDIELSALVLAILLSFAAFVTATEDESDGFKGGGGGEYNRARRFSGVHAPNKQVSSRSIELTILLSDYPFFPSFFFFLTFVNKLSFFFSVSAIWKLLLVARPRSQENTSASMGNSILTSGSSRQLDHVFLLIARYKCTWKICLEP